MINENKYELIKFEDGEFSLDVNVSPNEETVWLTQEQIAILFEVNKPAVNKHIKNILLSGELDDSTISKMEIVQLEGKRKIVRNINIYNLDMIISVGYRVKSIRGIQFRRWANSILKQYLLHGQVINQTRCLAHSDNLIQMNNTIAQINSAINNMDTRLTNVELRLDTMTSIDIFKDKIFYDGQLYEGYSLIKNLFHKAKSRIIIIDAYLDYSVLEMINDINIPITIYIASHTPLTNREIALFQTNHRLNIIRTNNYHDRFIIIDEELYSIGSSIKDIGKKISHISKLETINIDELLQKYLT